MKFNARATGVIAATAIALAVGGITRTNSHACINAGMSWSAPLVHIGGASKTVGTATMQFDTERPIGTLTVEAQSVRNVERIEIRAARKPGDLYGPPVAVVYDARDGAFHGKVSKFLSPSDIIKQSRPHIANLSDLATAMVHGGTAVAVCTKEHPRGEAAGLINLRPILIYSNTQGEFHDPKLHHLHQ